MGVKLEKYVNTELEETTPFATLKQAREEYKKQKNALVGDEKLSTKFRIK